MRLIDADALMKTIIQKSYTVTDYWNSRDAGMFLVGIEQAINEQPTIEERKTGKWIRVHGFVTPGGDPVWCCSECGKGVHVYGIEHGTYGADISDGQWKACPNCGADMREQP